MTLAVTAGLCCTRRILSERVVNPAPAAMTHAVAKEVKQTPFAERDYMVQRLATTASNPAFRHGDCTVVRFGSGPVDIGKPITSPAEC